MQAGGQRFDSAHLHQELSLDKTSLNVFRGDCYTNTVTMRINRNFIDSEVPVNEIIMDDTTWSDNYGGYFNTINGKEEGDKSDKGDYSKINRADVSLDNLLNNLNENYNMTYDFAKDNYSLDMETNIARDEVVRLKKEIEYIGNVNLDAPEEYDKAKERFDFLTNQKEDLINAENTLYDIINEMDGIMKEKLLTTFEKVREEFKKVYRELFRGGRAELSLTDPSNILETGIEIKAEPPGKKLQSISLLSGGEKTFTAISLLFAILNIRPVPFCLFDEVEAALDDANVEAFGKYLEKYKDTQFIIITHKKKTMEYANILYGYNAGVWC